MMNLIRFLLLFCSLIHGAIRLTAQELPVSQLYLHQLAYINPACVGRNYCTDFYITDRHQWLGIAQAPSTQVLGIEHTVLPNPYKASRKYGLSLEFLSDRNGAVRQTGGQAGYAFHTRLNKKKELFLSLGLKFSLLQHSISESESNVVNDPVLGAGESQLIPDAAAGIFIYHPKFYAGISMARLLPNSRYFYQKTTTAFIPGNFFLIAGYHYTPKSGSFSLNPMLVYKMDQQMNRQIDFNLIAGFARQFQAGISCRQNIDQFPGSNAGLQFLIRTTIQKIQITYVAEVSLNQTQSNHFGSHELGVKYSICYREKPQCPAFE